MHPPVRMQGFVLTALLFASSLAFPTSNHVVHERRAIPHDDQRKRLDPDAIIPIRIALRQSNLHLGHDQLMDVSHPSSPNYGKHLSAEDVHNLFAPAEDSVKAVKEWLSASGVNEDNILHYTNKGWLALDVPASHAEDLLKTEYYEYEKDGSHRIGCDQYSLPAHISEHVDLIKPGITLSAPLKKRTVKRDSSDWPSPGWPNPGWPQPPHFPPHHWPHWQPPPGAPQLPPDLRQCAVNIT